MNIYVQQKAPCPRCGSPITKDGVIYCNHHNDYVCPSCYNNEENMCVDCLKEKIIKYFKR